MKNLTISPEMQDTFQGLNNSDTGNQQDKSTKNVSDFQTFAPLFSYFQAPIKNIVPYKEIGLKEIAKVIKGDYHTEKTRQLRNAPTAEKSNIKGSKFDYCTFSGTFSARKNDALKSYSGLMALDFDHIKPDEVKALLLNQSDIDTVLLFVSPSGDGVKWVVPATTAEEHADVFRMYERYLKAELNLEVDKSGKDIARACFIPADKNVIFNETYHFNRLDKYWHDEPKATPDPEPKQPNTDQKKQYNGVSPFDDYNSRGDVLALLTAHGWREESRNDAHVRFTRPGKNDGVSADFRFSDKLLHVFTSSTKFEGNKAYNPSQVFGVLECNGDAKETRRRLLALGYGDAYVSFTANDETYFRDLQDAEAGEKEFNFYTDDFKISSLRLAEFFSRNGFIRISEEGNDQTIIVKSENKILKPYNHETETLSFLKNQIKHQEKKAQIAEMLAKDKAKIQKSFLLMDSEPYRYNRDTKDTIYFPFKNGVAKITKNGVEMLDYNSKELSFFYPVESIKHSFESFDVDAREVGQFEQFLTYAVIGRKADVSEMTQAERNKLFAYFSMMGYLCSNHKDKAKSPAIVLTDEGADGISRVGGRGKTTMAIAPSFVKCENYKGGEEFDPTYRHRYADLQTYHDIFRLDDVPANFRYDALYTQITDNITAERKSTVSVKIPFEDTPKFVITTNYVFRYDAKAVSTNRRFLEYKVSDFWNEKNTPADFFKTTVFSGWDEIEWKLFFQFLTTCAVFFLREGLQQIVYEKETDNWMAYFANDATLLEFERIFKKLEMEQSFSVADFLKEHNAQYGEKFFHKNNAKTFIETYLNAQPKKWKYDIKWRKWEKITSFIADEVVTDVVTKGVEVVTDGLPF